MCGWLDILNIKLIKKNKPRNEPRKGKTPVTEGWGEEELHNQISRHYKVIIIRDDIDAKLRSLWMEHNRQFIYKPTCMWPLGWWQKLYYTAIRKE